MRQAQVPDLVDEIVATRAARNPLLPELVGAAEARRALLQELVRRRAELGYSQTAVAARMETSQSAVARLEGSAADTKLSTVDRYAATLGCRVEWRVVDVR